MKSNVPSVLWAGLLAIAVAGCSSTGMNDSNATASAIDAAQGGGLGAVNSTSDSGTAASADNFGSYARNSAAVPANSTVTSIEVVQRDPDSAPGGSTTIGSSGSGATGSSTVGERMYRITVRMDDGTSQVVTQDAAPSFVSGARVRTIGGAIVR